MYGNPCQTILVQNYLTSEILKPFKNWLTQTQSEVELESEA